MGVTRNPDDGEPTVVMPARAEAVPPEITRFLAASKRARRRRLVLYGAAGIVFLAGMAAGGWFFFPRNEQRIVYRQPAVAVTRPQTAAPAAPAAPPTALPASAPAPRLPDKPTSPRQMLKEIFDGRERAHAVTASIESGTVRISSSKPGYVYVLAASANEADASALFAAVLFPRAADTNNRIQPGQPLTLPDLRWPTNAELLAIVSDEPRDIDVLGSLAGKVVCSPAQKCSEAYGAVAFSHDGSRPTVRTQAAPPAPAAAQPTSRASRRCIDILERASLGEQLTDEEQTFLRRDCR
jgi:hypothetical protein